MEPDSQSFDSDDGIDLSVKSEYFYPGDYLSSEDVESTVLEAKVVYLLLPKNVPVSRASRLQWLLDHINTVITVPILQKSHLLSNAIEIVSAIAREQHISKSNRYLINCRTEVIFLAHTYRFVYCLDMSPSQSVVDIQRGEILFDEILGSFKASVEGLAKQFTIPGNSVVFQPSLYLTVMVNTPFFISPAQQVLVKGVRITPANLQEIISFIQNQFHLLEGKIADVTATVHDQNEVQKMQYENITGGLFELTENENVSKIPMVSPDGNFVNMLRYSMLAVSLLPENSISHILVITDGVVAMPDSNIMETLLYQLHYDSTAVSFIKVGSSFHPHSSAGYISYSDLLQFLSQSTMGSCMESCPEPNHEPSMPMNVYHEFFLLWSFHGTFKIDNRKFYDSTKWRSPNDSFYSHKAPVLLSKRQTDEVSGASILLLLARRMREGFVVDNINYTNGSVEVQMSLQWKSFIYIIYKLSSQWPTVKSNTHLEVYISAPYEFLHDITCLIKKDAKSSYRQAIIERFWMRLSQLSSVDLNFAQQLSAFQNSNVWYTLPESVRSGIPVFNLNAPCADSNTLPLSPSSTTCPKFVNAWQGICQMETGNWRKWFHTHKVSLILKHDNPLPKHLHLPNSSQRYQVVQCRQAATALYGKLSDWASFVLIDNHTYLKHLHKEQNKPPVWFCIVRISSKLPCAVVNLGFVTDTPGYVRHETCEYLKKELAALSYMPSPAKSKENVCCVLLQKPLEKILIRYERLPNDFNTVIFPDGTQPPHKSMNHRSPPVGSLLTTLSRYLFHKRWIWNASHTPNPRLLDNAISRILTSLTRMRIKEGFSFAHSSCGIITMVLELSMDPHASCMVQYVLFPPHRAWTGEDCCSESEEEDVETRCETDLQMVTEVWIEPQYGKVQIGSNSTTSYMNNKHYYELADVISQSDFQCINSLLTMEHLSLMCREKKRWFGAETCNSFNRQNTRPTPRKNDRNDLTNLIDEPKRYPIVTPRIENVPFVFDPINILPLCHQTELLFSMFTERRDKSAESDKSNKLLLDNMQEHFILLHDREINITKEESDRFIGQIVSRRNNLYPHRSPFAEFQGSNVSDKLPTCCRWRCFIKGISVTHVILTFIPSSLSDLKALVQFDPTNLPGASESKESVDDSSRGGSNYSDVPINATTSLTLPIYVYDCPLASLVSTYIHSPEESKVARDLYEDHRFKNSDSVQDEYLKLRTESNNGSPDTKVDDYDTHDDKDKSNLRHHCKTLVLVHSKCFTISLYVALHREIYVHSADVQSVVDQCEEAITEIDITDYILTICGHTKRLKDDHIQLQELRQAAACNELKSLHRLITDKFLKMINVAFIPIPTNPEYYFCRHFNSTRFETNKTHSFNNVSDEDVSNPPSEKDFSVYSDGFHVFQRTESGIGDMMGGDICPLFLHLVCTLRCSAQVANTPVRVLPTCLGELTETIDSAQFINRKKVQVSLDIFSLTLPAEVQNVITEYSTQGLRTTSFSSDGFQPSIASTMSETSVAAEIPEPLTNLPDNQKKSLILLRDEIKWLLKDEIAAALLDLDTVTSKTLDYIMKHVAESRTRSSCILDVIHLNFVFGSGKSHEKFIEEFAKIKIPGYKLVQEDGLYYLAKDDNFEGDCPDPTNCGAMRQGYHRYFEHAVDFRDEMMYTKDDDLASQPSDMSSVTGSVLGTDCTGYDEDVSNDDDDDDYEWLQNLNVKRENLPNFWLITKVEQETVTIFFHCRFLELATPLVGIFLEVQRNVSDEIRDLCKKVNQSLLLRSLYETRICDSLLEPDDNPKDWHGNNCPSPNSRNSSYRRLRSMDEINDESEVITSPLPEASSLNFKSGHFKCPVVWQTHFVLHPRLKTGPGKSGLSRGILALKNILEKFSVSNRTNMFVYRDNQSNVFYLRLHENVRSSGNKSAQLRPLEFENAIVSRSPSIASLPLGQTKSNLTQCEQNLSSVLSEDIRPRVRSFGEKESKDGPCEDTLILKVHGITEAGNDVQCELVQVLQNRLDDAVLEFLSVMLARNAMCPLTPEDVQFIQKPFRLPELIIKLTIQDFVLQRMESFIHYLKQNLLQFLNIPKYTDNRAHYHFKDYSESDQALNQCDDDCIFLYNQSQNPSSGNRGIACVALGVVHNFGFESVEITPQFFERVLESKCFQNMVASRSIEDVGKLPPVHLEFRLWKQGRVNVDNLTVKLRNAVSQATWDLVMEYLILTAPLCEENSRSIPPPSMPIDVTTDVPKTAKETEFNCILDVGIKNNVKIIGRRKLEKLFVHRKRIRRTNPPTAKVTRSITFDDYERDKEIHQTKHSNPKPITNLNSFETGDEGILCKNYSKYLPSWLEFGSVLAAPSVKKQKIVLTIDHLPGTAIKELLNFVQDTPKAFRAIPSHPLCENNDQVFVPHDPKKFLEKCVIISLNFDNWKASTGLRESSDYTDLNPQALKHSQKFVPTTINNKFIPRQKILWILVQSDSILVYTYNWSKEGIDKLIGNCTKLGHWLSVRSCFLNSVTAQKLGLFHNQSLVQKNFSASSNPYTCTIGSTSLMVEFPRDETRKSFTGSQNLSNVLDAFRDSHHILKYNTNDPVGVFTIEMHEMKIAEKKIRDEMKKLHSMYQSRTSTTTVPQIFLLMQNSRIIHYCHTPLLFLPEWRLKSAATRDHTLRSPTHRTQKNALEKDSWHTELCYGFFCEYRRYLQTLGFMPLQIDNSDKKLGIWGRDNSSYNYVFYIQKTIMGGILIFTVEFNEPFFTTRLHAIECNRLQTITSRASINRFTLCFLDECDRVKILMHLHSFTYDYHLRCIYNYISNNAGVNKVCNRYNATKFFDDFMKYYNKAPNFARNLIHADTIMIKNLKTEGKQLYDYLLRNVDQYEFRILDMDKGEGEVEYILVQVTSSPQVTYKDSQDREHTDDFEITLVVYNMCTPYCPTDNIFHLKYYLILTSKREIYPKSDIEPKLGKFRAVSLTACSSSALEKTSSLDESGLGKLEESELTGSGVECCSDEDRSESSDANQQNHYRFNSPPNVEISQESVNYLGYYSSHEQLMQQMILDKARTTQRHIREMVAKGMVHCRTHILWNKLVSPQDSHSLNYDEFIELKSLAKLEHLCDVHSNLGPLLNQPLSWYQGLAKLLLTKYIDQNRTFVSTDGNIQHYVILEPRYFGAFMLLSIDLHTARGDLYAVFREPHKQEDAKLYLAYRKALLDGFVNCICFYLWYGMI